MKVNQFTSGFPNQHLLCKTRKKNPYNEDGITTCYANMEYFEDESKDVFHYEGEFYSRHSIRDISRWIKSKNISYSLDAYEEVFGDVSRYEEGNIEKCRIDFKKPNSGIIAPNAMGFVEPNSFFPHDREIWKFNSYLKQQKEIETIRNLTSTAALS
jgi:hypothetical protein